MLTCTKGYEDKAWRSFTKDEGDVWTLNKNMKNIRKKTTIQTSSTIKKYTRPLVLLRNTSNNDLVLIFFKDPKYYWKIHSWMPKDMDNITMPCKWDSQHEFLLMKWVNEYNKMNWMIEHPQRETILNLKTT